MFELPGAPGAAASLEALSVLAPCLPAAWAPCAPQADTPCCGPNSSTVVMHTQAVTASGSGCDAGRRTALVLRLLLSAHWRMPGKVVANPTAGRSGRHDWLYAPTASYFLSECSVQELQPPVHRPSLKALRCSSYTCRCSMRTSTVTQASGVCCCLQALGSICAPCRAPNTMCMQWLQWPQHGSAHCRDEQGPHCDELPTRTHQGRSDSFPQPVPPELRSC